MRGGCASALGRGWPALFARSDVVLVMTDPPMASVVAALVAKLRRLPLVVYVRDLHPDMAITAGLLRPGRVSRLWDALQTWALRRAARVIVLGTDMRRRVLDKACRRRLPRRAPDAAAGLAV